MSVYPYLHNGESYSIETIECSTDPVQFRCVIFPPHIDQLCSVLGGQIFPTRNAAIEAAIKEIRRQIPQISFLKDFMEQLKETVRRNYPKPYRFLISKLALRDWRKLSQDDWERDGWEGEDQDLTSMGKSDEVFEALQKRLARVGIREVLISDIPYMEIVPVNCSE